jgi:hypothetical protein
MLQRVCLVLSVYALASVFGGGLTYASWDGLGLTSARDATSLVISVKKHKHNDDDDNGDNQKHKKNKDNDRSDDSASESDEGPKDSKTSGGNASSGSTTDDVPKGTLLLPYFECDLDKHPNGCSH